MSAAMTVVTYRWGKAEPLADALRTRHPKKSMIVCMKRRNPTS
jgi:hypothetical protein